MIPKNKFTEIQGLRERGDASRLSEMLGIPESTMYLVLRTGKCNSELAASILKFYEVRKAERRALEKLLKDQD